MKVFTKLLCLFIALALSLLESREAWPFDASITPSQESSQNVSSSSFFGPDGDCRDNCEICDELSIQCDNLKLTNWEFLYLMNNFTISTVEYFKFTGNMFGSLMTPIFGVIMPSLRFLDLSNNNLSSIESKDVFKNLPSLNKLFLDNNKIELSTQEDFESLSQIGSSLTELSLKSALALTDLGNLNMSTSQKVFNLINVSKLYSLKVLRLSELFIQNFNGDLFCLLPHLETLNLELNIIQRFEFDETCIGSKIRLINLRRNQLNRIDASLVSSLKQIKSKSAGFQILLDQNDFKCDCTLYSFYAFLIEDRGNIVGDGEELLCSNKDSIYKTLNKRIVDSNLHRFCHDKPISPPIFTRYKTTISSTTSPQTAITTTRNKILHRAYSINRLFMFLFVVMIISSCILLMFKVHCKKMLATQSLFFYNRLRTPNEPAGGADARLHFDSTTDTRKQSTAELDDESIDMAPAAKKSRFGFLSKLFKRDGGEDLPTYRRFDSGVRESRAGSQRSNRSLGEGVSAMKIFNKKKKMSFKQLSLADQDDDEDRSDKEEILMDSIYSVEGNVAKPKSLARFSPEILATRLP